MTDQPMHKSYSGFYLFGYLVLYVSTSSMLSSRSLHVSIELLVPSESLLVKFCTMDGGGFYSLMWCVVVWWEVLPNAYTLGSIVQNFTNNESEGTSNSVGTYKLPEDGIDNAETYKTK
jgi:hypothetical protein